MTPFYTRHNDGCNPGNKSHTRNIMNKKESSEVKRNIHSWDQDKCETVGVFRLQELLGHYEGGFFQGSASDQWVHLSPENLLGKGLMPTDFRQKKR